MQSVKYSMNDIKYSMNDINIRTCLVKGKIRSWTNVIPESNTQNKGTHDEDDGEKF